MKNTNKKIVPAIYAIWELLSYYSELLNLEVPKCPCKQSTLVGSDDKITILISTVPKRCRELTEWTPVEIKDILNSYIPFLLYEKYPQLPPFFGGNPCGDIIEALYIYSVFEQKTSYQINTVLVNNPEAYHLVIEDRKSGGRV